jgi:hypothetical protein
MEYKHRQDSGVDEEAPEGGRDDPPDFHLAHCFIVLWLKYSGKESKRVSNQEGHKENVYLALLGQ